MDDFLTSKELQELLKIDRTTVYRMLKDGRLTGVKIGDQWRFSRKEVTGLLTGAAPAEPFESSPAPVLSALPLQCVQYIQDVFADVAEVGSVTVTPAGEPLSEVSCCSRFCNLILASESGRRACVASWGQWVEEAGPQPGFATCHAGLHCTHARIQVEGRLEALLVAEQFYTTAPDPTEEEIRVRKLAATHNLDPAALAEAIRDIPVLDERKQARIHDWLQSVARTFEHIGRERAELMGRLRHIAALSTIQPD